MKLWKSEQQLKCLRCALQSDRKQLCVAREIVSGDWRRRRAGAILLLSNNDLTVSSSYKQIAIVLQRTVFISKRPRLH